MASAVGAVLRNHDNAEARVRQYVLGAGDKEFFASDVGFRATFPTVPDRSTETIRPDGRDHQVVIYSSGLGDASFMVMAMDLFHTHADLNLAVNGAAAATKGHVESSQLTTFAGVPAAEFLISVPGGAYAKGLVLEANGRLFTLVAVGRTNPPSGYDHFKQSFHLGAS
jgi:hypothetical protein